MKVIPAEESHRAAWLEMRVALWPEGPAEESTQEITRILESDREDAFLATTDAGEAIGFAEVSTRDYVDGCRTSPVGFLEWVYVRPSRQMKGVGRALVRAAETWALARDCTEMGSDTHLDALDSIAFHQALGFEEAERQVVFRKSIAGE